MIKSIYVALFSLSLLISGCSTPGEINLGEQKQSLMDLQKAAEASLPGGKRSVSQNARTFTSNYFGVKKDGTFEEAPEASTRYAAQITIYGDRRPYTIGVIVFKEKRSGNGEYDKLGPDEGLARVVSRRIQKTLHERREDRSIIDEFRIF